MSPRAGMTAMVLASHGGPDVLRQQDLPVPALGPGEILVRVAACGVCGHDLLARRGALGAPEGQILGHEIAGRVVRADDGCGFSAGDRVVLNQRRSCGHCPSCERGAPNLCTRGPGFYGDDLPGGYADYVVAQAQNTVHLPAHVDFVTAAALPCGVATGLHALRLLAVAEGETVLVTGASGGVGIHTVMLARAAGARPVAIVRDATVEHELRDAGAEWVVTTSDGSFAPAVRALLPEGVDAAVECVGTPTFPSTLRALRAGGRMAIVGNVSPGDASLPIGRMILKEIRITGSSHATARDLAEAVSLVDHGAITPRIGARFDLRDAASAHEFAERSTTLGRVVLVNAETEAFG